jgi:hypothetical protein
MAASFSTSGTVVNISNSLFEDYFHVDDKMINEKTQKIENGYHEQEDDEIFPEATSEKVKEVKKIRELIQSKDY